jgi:photosystem II stability/assembly factor-like uncharacterized protein
LTLRPPLAGPILRNPFLHPGLSNMIPHPTLRRVAASTLLAIALTALAANTGRGDDPPTKDTAREKEIASLEKQLADLQAKLKALKEPPTASKIVTPAEEIIPAGWVNQFQWRCIGPATMGGRITAISVFEADPTTFWVATASGGLVKTTNNGISYEHQFDRESTVSVGSVCVAPSSKDIVWVGTGENNPRNSVSFGDGVFKSIDGGKTWKNMGLKTSYQIGKIVVHPTNPDIVFVGALGRLYGPGGERGLFKTEDGGKTWKNVLPQTDDKTGVIDVAMNPAEPNTILVATWQRQRDEFDSFLGEAKPKAPGGADEYAPSTVHARGGAIYRSTDGGNTFTKATKGLPTVNLGRVGFDWSRKTPKTCFAIIDTEKIGMGKVPPRVYAGFQSETKDGNVAITSVTADAPAAKAGFKAGDLIIAVDGTDIKSYEAMIDEFRKKVSGDKAKFSVLRGKDRVDVEITFAPRPEDRPIFGVTPEEGEGGLKLSEVLELGPAAKAGLLTGDIIFAVDDTPTKTRADLNRVVVNKKVGDKVKVTFSRGMERKSVDLTLETATQAGRPFAQGAGGQSLGGQVGNVSPQQQGPEANETGGIYKSIDGGESWTRLNSLNPRPFYFSLIRVDPSDDDTIYVGGIKLFRSTNGGKTFSQDGVNDGVHDDQHALWIDPKNGRHLIIGTDGGFYVSYDKAARWDHQNHAGALGQFYHVAVDTRTPYRVYGGLQDNGSWGGPSRSDRWPGPINEDWINVLWGDGFVCRVDPHDPDIIYAESQDGNMARRNLKTGASARIAPRTRPGLHPFRFNWNTPFILSQHNSSIFYAAGNYVLRSLKQGTELYVVSPEISLTKRGTGTAVSESPRNPDVVWAGTDDGAVWITKDGCKSWTNLSEKFKAAGLPGPRWVSTIEASRHADGRCYVVFDAHRSNDDNPYVFVTEDFGETWKSLKANLPVGPTRVCREDIANQNLLYLGTEFGCYASVNRGIAWTRLNGEKGLPTVAVHEFAQPTTANDLVIATHGRSLWVLDVTPLRQMTGEIVKGKTTLFSPSPAIAWQRQNPVPFYSSHRVFNGQNPARGAMVDYVLAKKAEKVSLVVKDVTGRTVRELQPSTDAGYHRLTWEFDLTRGGGGGGGGRPGGGGGGGGAGLRPKGPNTGAGEPPSLNPLNRPTGGRFAAEPGEYRIVLIVDGAEFAQTLTVEADPSVPRQGISAPDEHEEDRQLEKAMKRRPMVWAGD